MERTRPDRRTAAANAMANLDRDSSLSSNIGVNDNGTISSYPALTNVVRRTNAAAITTVEAIKQLLLDFACALGRDNRSDEDKTILYNVIYVALSLLFQSTALEWGRFAMFCQGQHRYSECRGRKPIAIHVRLPQSTHKIRVVLHDWRINNWPWTLVYPPDPTVTVLVVDVNTRTVTAGDVRPNPNDPTKPAITRDGKPCKCCQQALKKHGRRCRARKHQPFAAFN